MTDAVSRSNSTPAITPGKHKDLATRREEARDAFQKAIGNTFYRQMMKSLRESTSKAAYMHGGQAEDIFQAQLDEILIERMSEANGGDFSDRLFEQQFPNFRETRKMRAESDRTSTAKSVSGEASVTKAAVSVDSAISRDAASNRAKADEVSKPATPADVLRRLDDERRQQDAVEHQQSTASLTHFSFDV
jgi:hypothetical protein